MFLASGRLRRFWAWFPLITFLLFLIPQSFAQQTNVTIYPNASEVDYTPFLCDNASSSNNTAVQCQNAWQVITLNGSTFVSTDGPALGGIIPQMFFQFRASAFYLSTSILSNATTNLTVSNNGTVLSAVFNSSVGMASVLNLEETVSSTVALTFIPSTLPTLLDIGAMILTVSGNPATSVFLPSMTLPASATLPTFESATPSSSSTPVGASSDHDALVAEAVGITLGLSLGLTVIAVLGYLWWRRYRRQRSSRGSLSDSEASRSPRPPWPPLSRPQPATAQSGWAAHSFEVHGHNQRPNEKRRWRW